MLPELIFREERVQNWPLLGLLGFFTAVLGFGASQLLFPSEAGLVSVILASIPLVYPLTKFFLEDEKEGRPHIPEILTYGSIFAGLVAGFFVVGYTNPEALNLQISMFQEQLGFMGITGYAVNGASFLAILMNNLMVFSFVLATATIIGSAGVFILAWNASVLGVFLAVLTRELSGGMKLLTGTRMIPTPLAYVPHATLEMTGFIVAGIVGSLLSGSIYRAINSFLNQTNVSDLSSPKKLIKDISKLIMELIEKIHWADYGKMIGFGILLIVLGAFVETA